MQSFMRLSLLLSVILNQFHFLLIDPRRQLISSMYFIFLIFSYDITMPIDSVHTMISVRLQHRFS